MRSVPWKASWLIEAVASNSAPYCWTLSGKQVELRGCPWNPAHSGWICQNCDRGRLVHWIFSHYLLQIKVVTGMDEVIDHMTIKWFSSYWCDYYRKTLVWRVSFKPQALQLGDIVSRSTRFADILNMASWCRNRDFDRWNNPCLYPVGLEGLTSSRNGLFSVMVKFAINWFIGLVFWHLIKSFIWSYRVLHIFSKYKTVAKQNDVLKKKNNFCLTHYNRNVHCSQYESISSTRFATLASMLKHCAWF